MATFKMFANIHFVFYLMTTLVWRFFSFPIKQIGAVLYAYYLHN